MVFLEPEVEDLSDAQIFLDPHNAIYGDEGALPAVNWAAAEEIAALPPPPVSIATGARIAVPAPQRGGAFAAARNNCR